MSDIAIHVENLGKRYQLSHRTGLNLSLREAVTSSFDRLLGHSSRPHSSHASQEEFWALHDLNFEIKAGETVAIIGANGAGKSTLLKILSRVTSPTTGKAIIEGRVASLLEVGTGFHPELTGRENIFLNGAILGMSRTEIRRKFDPIVAFAEIEKFIDTPVKRYSSGMYTRLAFAVAAHLDCEILIVDEVLSVGDAAFQAKSFAKMSEIMAAGKTILFVSHNLAAAQKLCQTGFLLRKGRLVYSGPVSQAVAAYLGTDNPQQSSLNLTHGRETSPDITLTGGSLLRANGQPAHEFLPGETLRVRLNVEVHKACTFSPELLLRDHQSTPLAFSPGGLAGEMEFTRSPGPVTIETEIDGLHLASGRYALDVILAESGVRFLDYIESGFTFTVLPGAIGHRNWHFRQSQGQGSLLLPPRFRIVS